MSEKMKLTAEQQAILDGEKGETLAKVMETLVRYGELFGADSMVPVTSQYNHLVTSFGLKALGPVYDLMDKLIAEGAASQQKFSADPRPLDKNVPSSFLQNFVFQNFMYTKQDFYEEQLQKLGLMDKDAFTCACYMDQVGNTPKEGDILSWSESSAVVYANSVLGARCNRNSGIIDLMGSVVGYVPNFGLLTDEGRKATWVVEIKTTKKPEAQLLGSAIGMKVMEDVPYIVGLDQWLGTLDDGAKTYLKDFGAATASNGAVGLYQTLSEIPGYRGGGPAGPGADRGRGPDLRDRRRGAPAGVRQLPAGVEEQERQTQAVLHGLSPHEFGAAHHLDPAGGAGFEGIREEKGGHPHCVYRRSGGH